MTMDSIANYVCFPEGSVQQLSHLQVLWHHGIMAWATRGSVDRHIIETGNSVGNFRLISMCGALVGSFLHAM